MKKEAAFLQSFFVELDTRTRGYLKQRRITGKNRYGSSELSGVITPQGSKRADNELSPDQFHAHILFEAEQLAKWLEVPTYFTAEDFPFEFVLTLAGSRHTCDEIQALDGTPLPGQIVIWVFDKKDSSHPVRLYEIAERTQKEKKEFARLSEAAFSTAMEALQKGSDLPQEVFYQNVHHYLLHGNQDDTDRLMLGGGRGPGSNTMMHSMVTLFTPERQKRENIVFKPDEVLKFSSPVDAVFMQHVGTSLSNMLRKELPFDRYPYTVIHMGIEFDEPILLIDFNPPQPKSVAEEISLKAVEKLQELHMYGAKFFKEYNLHKAERESLSVDFIQTLEERYSFLPAEAEWLKNYLTILQPDVIQLEQWLASEAITYSDSERLSKKLERNYQKAERYSDTELAGKLRRAQLARTLRRFLGGKGHLSDIAPLTYLMTDRLIPGRPQEQNVRSKLLKNARAVHLPKEASFVISQKPIINPENGELAVAGVGLISRNATQKGGAESVQNAPIVREQKL